MDYTALTFEAPREKSPPIPQEGATSPNPQRLIVENLEVVHSHDLRLASLAVKRTAVPLKRPWRKEISWNRGERNGPIISIDVSEACADRALLLGEQIISGARSLGWSFD